MTPEQYLAAVDLSNTPREIVAQDAATEPNAAVFDQARTQAQVIGAGVFSFAPAVTVPVREAVSDSMLLAQLVANKQSSTEADPLRWFGSCTDVLTNLGWTLAAGGWTDYTSQGTATDVHHEILAVLTAVLGPMPTALAIVTASVGALKATNPQSSWIRIFSRESQHARIARFQLGCVEQDAGTIAVSLVACLIEATSSITQVLLFKFREDRASFRASSPRLSTTISSLVELHPRIQAKVRDYQSSYLSSIANL
jgi:hypothetical protein